MKTVLASIALAAASCAAVPAFSQAMPPPLPTLTAEQSARVNQESERYQREVDQRLARNEINADEAQRLLAWHQWQFAKQVSTPAARQAGVPPDYVAPPVRYYESAPYYAAPAPYYAAPYPYYAYPAPYYVGPRAYWGPTVCAGGFGRHSFARFCL